MSAKVFVVALAALAIAAALALHPFATAEAPPPPICMDADTRERTRTLMFQGIEDGLKRHTSGVFDVWIKDPKEQPERAARGMHIGISAYVRSRASLLNWSPPRCKPEQPQ